MCVPNTVMLCVHFFCCNLLLQLNCSDRATKVEMAWISTCSDLCPQCSLASAQATRPLFPYFSTMLPASAELQCGFATPRHRSLRLKLQLRIPSRNHHGAAQSYGCGPFWLFWRDDRNWTWDCGASCGPWNICNTELPSIYCSQRYPEHRVYATYQAFRLKS